MEQKVHCKRNPSDSGNQEKTSANEPVGKPHVVRVEMPGAVVRFVGITAAARWLGCTCQALGQIARGKYFCDGPLAKRARAEFPELFGDAAGLGTGVCK